MTEEGSKEKHQLINKVLRTKTKRVLHVFLGRFAPIHKGHQMIINAMLTRYGTKNCLLLVGSSNSLDKRTPFSFEVRRLMITTLYPHLPVLPIPDSTPNIARFDAKGDKVWLANIKRLESKLKASFHFVGGSKKDLKTLGHKFHTEVLIPRHTHGKKISATKARILLMAKGTQNLEKLLDGAIVKIAKRYLKNTSL